MFPLRVALETLDRLTESLDFTDYASRIIHPIVRALDSTPDLRATAMDTLSSLVFQLGKKVAKAVPGACNYVAIIQKRPASLLLASDEQHFSNPFTPLVFITSCQTADVIGHFAAGGWCLQEWMRSRSPLPLSVKHCYRFQA